VRGRIVHIAVGTLALAFAASCGYYSTTGRTAGDIKRIAVPFLKNATAEPQIEIDITNRIIDGLVRDNTLKVVPIEEADAILEGSIVQYQNIPFTFNTQVTADETQLRADQYRLIIGIKFALLGTKTNAYIWQDKAVVAHGDYYLNQSAEQNYEKALDEVYRDIVEKILSATVQEW
jgi:hypothetical protein